MRIKFSPTNQRLDDVTRRLLAVDGTFFTVAPRVAWAVYNKPNKTHKPRKGNIRVDVHFNVQTGVPERGVVTNGRVPEYATLSDNLVPDAFYVLDRAYHRYQTLADIVEAGSDFLVRLRADMKFDVVAEHALPASDKLLGVHKHQMVRPCGGRGRKALGDRRLTLVEIDGDDGKPLRLLTNRVDLSVAQVGYLYRHRWQVELFFRWLKCLVNFRHFFSESENGAALQIAAALIGTLLIALEIDARPSVYDWSMMCNVMSGLVPMDDDTRRIMARRHAASARDSRRAKERLARQKNSR